MKHIFTFFNIGWLMLMVLLTSTHAFAQIEVKGMITDKNGQGLVGASVQEIGSTHGVATDIEGRFRLTVANTASKLRVSYQGFYPKDIKVNEMTNLIIVLEENIWQLRDMVVTATRSPSDIENVPQKVRVISSQEISQTIANDITDVLKKTAGVDVIQYPGLLSGVGIRGFRPQFSGINQRTLLLIDGRPAGATNLSLIDMNNVERIEVLKGPASALYGAQAMGGVINVITKKTKGTINGRVYGGIGSFDQLEAGVSVGGSITKRLDYDLSFRSYNQGDDFRLGGDNLFRDAFGWDKATRILWTEFGRQEVEIDDTRGDDLVRANTSYQSYSAALRLGYNLTDNWRIDVKADRFYADDVNTPGDIANGDQSPGLKDVDRYGGDVIIQGNISSKNELTLKFFGASEENTNYRVTVDTTATRETYVRSKNQLEWIGGQVMDRQQLGNHFLSVGIDYTKITQDNRSFNSLGDLNPASAQRPNFNQQNLGIYAQAELNFLEDRLNFTAGLRNETIWYNITGTDLFPSRSETNNTINPSFGVNYNVMPNIFLHATFGTAFTTLGVFQIAGYDERSVDANPSDGVDTVDVFIGNADLENQKSRTFDIGIRYVNEAQGFTFDLTYFNTNFENNVVNQVIQFPGIPSESGAFVRNYNTFANAQGTTLSGLEFEMNYRFGQSGIQAFANGVYIIQAEEIRDIFRQPQPLTLDMHNVANVNLNYGLSYEKLSWLSLHLNGRYVGRRFDTDWGYYLSPDNGFGAGDYADIRYPSFMTLDLITTFIYKNNQVSLMIGNLTDENYYEKRGFNLMGRNYMLRYSLNF